MLPDPRPARLPVRPRAARGAPTHTSSAPGTASPPTPAATPAPIPIRRSPSPASPPPSTSGSSRPENRAPTQHVWQCSVRTAPGDRGLSDEEWNAVAQRIVHATGIAPDGDLDGCRWIAVRHAEDHIHVVATLVRGDLRNPRLNYDFNKDQAECRRIEKEVGLRRLDAGDGTAAKNPISAEKFKAERTGRPETPRETLRAAVRRAVAGAEDEKEFFTRLHEAGLRVKVRHAPSGDALGYNVALPGDRNRDAEPVWYPGSKLAPDLSLPKIRRWLADGAAERTATPASGGLVPACPRTTQRHLNRRKGHRPPRPRC